MTAEVIAPDGSGGWAGMTKVWLLRGQPAEGLARLEQEHRGVDLLRLDALTQQQVEESLVACEQRLRSALPPRP
jgi:hypothetical protein